MAEPKPAREIVYSTLKRGPKKGLTVATISDRTGIKHTTIRTALFQLRHAGRVKVGPRDMAGRIGRPQNLYTVAS